MEIVICVNIIYIVIIIEAVHQNFAFTNYKWHCSKNQSQSDLIYLKVTADFDILHINTLCVALITCSSLSELDMCIYHN